MSRPDYGSSDVGTLDLARDVNFLKNLIKQVQDKFIGEWKASLQSRLNHQSQQFSKKMDQHEGWWQ